MCELKDYDWMKLDEWHRDMLNSELPQWHADYLPAGKTVVDLGAGCGETAHFYMMHGAERVIAIESDQDAYALLVENMKRYGDRVTCILAKVDNVKVDIEGGEEGMLVESHWPAEWKMIRAWGPELRHWKLTRK